MKPFCSFQNDPATCPLICSDLSYPFCRRVSVLQIHDRIWWFITEAIPIAIYLCYNDTEVLQSRSVSHCTRPCTKKETKSKSPKPLDISDLGTGWSPRTWLSLYCYPKKANPEGKERGGRYQIPESIPLHSQESRSQVWSNSKNEKKGLRCCRQNGGMGIIN